ncbi:MAG: Rne/Rng family ribonuclease [Acidobacteriota bacterium]|nr:Rne/Rng family ribonuclease [Acidobacteriota bacterium]
MSRKMLINARHSDELRVAIIDNGILEAYEVEAAESGLTRGNIYRGVVAKIESSLNAAFIDYGAERHGFLPGDDIVPDAYHKKYGGKGRPKIADVLERGKPILVQVTKEAVGQKGAALTTSISLAGRYMVLTPFDDTRGVSRKVEDDQNRKRLREQMGGFNMPDGCGAIARTNAQDQSKTNLNRDLNALLRLWKRIAAELSKGKGPRLLYSDQDLVLQALRDYLDSSIEEVHVDDDDVLKKAEQYMRAFMPRARTKLIRYDGRIPLFARFHLDEQIDRIYDRTVQLPSGGSIVIDGTEALTAIDVNSGRTRGGNSHEDTVARTNLEAAAEVARQLRMRDIGGLVVVDFIDMRHRRNHRKVEKALRDSMKVDRARVSIGRISDNGLLEINRQRIKQALQLRTHRPCPTCSGSGTIASPEFVGLSLLRRIEARAAAGDLRAVRIALHPELADGIQNNRRRELAQLEAEYGIRIEIVAATHLHRSEEQVEWKRGQGSKSEGTAPPRSAVAALTASDLMDGRSSRRRGRSRRSEEEEASKAESAAASDGAADSGSGEEQDGEEKKPRRRRRRRRRRRGSSGGDGAGKDASGSQQEQQGSQQRDSSKDSDKADEKAAKTSQDSKDSDQDGDEESTGRRRRRRRRGRSGSTRSRGGEDKSAASEDDSSAQQRDSQERRSRSRSRGRGKDQDDDNRGNRDTGTRDKGSRDAGNRDTGNRDKGTGGRRGRSGRSRRESSGGSDQQPHWDTQPTQRKKGGNRPHVGIAPVKPTLPDQPPSEERIRQKFGQPWYLRPVAESAKQEESAQEEGGKEETQAAKPSQEDSAQEAEAPKPTRRRRSTRAKKDADAAEDAPQSDEAQDAKEAEASEEKPKTRRRRSSTRSSSTKATKAKDEAPEEAEAKADTKADTQADDDAEDKPKTRRRRSSTRSSSTKATKAKEEAAEEPEAKADTQADDDAEDKPKTRRRRSSTRSSSTKAAKAKDEAPEEPETKADTKADDAEDKPKTRRRRSSTRSSSTKTTKAKEEAAEEAQSKGDDENEGEDKPKTRRRRSSTRSSSTRSSKAKKEAESAKDDDAEDKPKTRRRRGSTRSAKSEEE